LGEGSGSDEKRGNHDRQCCCDWSSDEPAKSRPDRENCSFLRAAHLALLLVLKSTKHAPTTIATSSAFLQSCDLLIGAHLRSEGGGSRRRIPIRSRPSREAPDRHAPSTVRRAAAWAAAGASAGISGETISYMQYYANGVPIGPALTTSPYAYSWSDVVAKSYSLTAIAVDNYAWGLPRRCR
jgi:hypothetical protein